MTDMTEEQRLAIECQCAKLINHYARLNDSARWAELAALYTDDGIFARPVAADTPVVGRAAILAAFEARPPRVTQHITANIVVDVVDDDNATATSALLLFTARDMPPLVGGFEDRLRRLPVEGWRFVERRGTLTFAAS